MVLILSDTYFCSFPVRSLSDMPTLLIEQLERSTCHLSQCATHCKIMCFCMKCMLNTVPTESELCELVPSWGVCWGSSPTLVLFCDRGWVHLIGYVNAQNNRYGFAENPMLIY
jgi:hypothetical protein